MLEGSEGRVVEVREFMSGREKKGNEDKEGLGASEVIQRSERKLFIFFPEESYQVI